jgi:hypothetical protein
MDQMLHTLSFIKHLSCDEVGNTIYKLLNCNIIDKLFKLILFFKDSPCHLLIPLRVLQDLAYGNNFIIELMINKKIAELLEKVVNTHQNSIHRDSSTLLIDIYFLLANLVGGYQSQTDFFVLQSNLIKQLFHIYKFKKGVPKLIYEMLIVLQNVLKNGSKQAILEILKFKFIDFITEIIYNTSDPDLIVTCLDCLSSLISRLEPNEKFIINFEQIKVKLENFKLHTNETISIEAESTLSLIERVYPSADIII